MTACTACTAQATRTAQGHQWCDRHLEGFLHAALTDGATPAGYVLDGAPLVRRVSPVKPKLVKSSKVWAPPVVLPPGASTESGRPRFRSRSWVSTNQKSHVWRTAL